MNSCLCLCFPPAICMDEHRPYMYNHTLGASCIYAQHREYGSIVPVPLDYAARAHVVSMSMRTNTCRLCPWGLVRSKCPTSLSGLVVGAQCPSKFHPVVVALSPTFWTVQLASPSTGTRCSASGQSRCDYDAHLEFGLKPDECERKRVDHRFRRLSSILYLPR
ncbi:hypothetical protein KQX54_020812 [Cotesia glomerata]|uniref:Uncharacterized protein n=1 Tax=Cotesia glomerata TaxID=32391 RepID=A0AAV7I0G1_COTGL|nr:hypothetical protein KQX54_020812 [Cotesia glomerata]